MKGFLKTPGWVFKLQPKTTTVGRHRDCDLCLQNGGVEEYHALIAWDEAERCFVLTDLNSAHGTFVNDCRIHNASVCLAPGDELHFGYGGSTYQLDVESSSLLLPCPPMTERPGPQSSLQLIEDLPLISSASSPSQLPLLPGQSLAPQAWVWGGSPVMPKPPSQAQPRPASAGAKRSGQQSGPSEQGPAVRRPVSWTGNTRSRSPQRAPAALPSSQTIQHLLQDKEERLQQLGEALRRLAMFEGESHRKDGVISGLRDQVNALRHQLLQNQPTTTTTAAAVDPEVKRRLRCLERNITDKKQQIQQLKEQMVDLQRNSIEMSRQSVTEKDMRISSLRGQMERLKRDSSAASGLVSSLQKDLSSREKQALKLASEVDRLRQDIRHKDIHLEANNIKFTKMSKKHQEELLNYENEVLTLKKRIERLGDTLRQKEICLQQQVTEKDTLKNRLEKKVEEQESVVAKTEAERLAQLQRNHAEMEQMKARVEHFRSQLFSMLEADHRDSSDSSDSTSQDALSDQQVLEQVANQLGEKESLKTQMVELEELLKQNCAEQDSLGQETEGLRRSLDACQSQIQEACSAEVLEKMISSLKEESISEALGWIRASVLSILTVHLSLLQTASQALQEAGMTVSDTPEGILNGIQTLHQAREAHNLELQSLRAELGEVRGSESQSRELKEQLDLTREELEQQTLQLTMVQQDKQARQRELEELRGQVDALKEAQNALQQEAQTRQCELLSKLQEAEEREEEWREREREARERGREEERERSRVQEEEYREQVRQHAHTIVALEQRWGQARLTAQSLGEERDSLREQLRELENRHPVQSTSPAEPSKPPEVAALEDTITSLRADLAQAQQEARNQGDIITSLSGDLAAANARITDMTGELSEQQKLELEQHRAAVVDQRVQLSTLTQKLSLMSQLVEQKGEELRKAKEELRQCQTELEKRINAETEKREQRHDQSQPDQYSVVACLPQHTKEAAPDTASRELAKQGSKCRGHRHDEVLLHQREAQAEMRARIRTLEQTSTLKRVSQQAGPKRLTNSERNKLSSQISAVTKDSVTSSSGWSALPGQLEEESLERTARLELSDALDLSERTYLDLARALCEALELSEGQLEGLDSLQHLPQEERARLGSLRHRDLELLRTRLALQHSHAQRRDTLLQEQSREISSLRESQAARLESLRAEVEGQAQETSLLRQALEQSVQRRADRQTGPYPAGRIHKTDSQERPQRKSDRTVSHSCVRTEPSDKGVAKTVSLQDRLRKSERQVETLKKQLEEREREFNNMAAKLTEQQQQQQEELHPQTPSPPPEPC